MRVLIVSDSHGVNENVRKAIKKAGKIDLMFHLGDVGSDYLEVEHMSGVPTYMVAGNNDLYGSMTGLRKQLIISVGTHKVFAVHGHLEGVHFGLNTIRYKALENGCDIAMFGHTHVPLLDEGDDVTILNPGSLTYPRQSGRKKTFMIMNIDDDGKVSFLLDSID